MKKMILRSKVKKLSIMMTIIFLLISIIGNVQATNNSKKESYVIEEVFDKNYWDWHTRTTTNDKAYNGEHIQMGNNSITFYGYGQNSYKDFLYKEFAYMGKKTFRITVDEKAASYHTLEGAGFLINSTIKDNKISGYVLLYAQKTIDIYRIDNIDLEQFKTQKNMKVSNYGELVGTMPKNASGIHNVIVEATPTYIDITDNSQNIHINLDGNKHVGDSFGLIASYLQHDCKILSKIIFEKFELEIENYVTLVKVINQEKEPLRGASFELKDSNGNVVMTGESNSEGEYRLVGLQEGTYTIKQTLPPSGYKENTQMITFQVTNDGKTIDVTTKEEIEVIFTNEPLPNKEENDNNNQMNNEISNEISNEIKNTIQDGKNTIKQEEKLPDRLPQTGENLKIIITCAAFGIILTYFAIKIKQYDYKE